MRSTLKIIFALIFLSSFEALCQKLEGVPFIRNYTPNEYGWSPENWTIAQDKRGVMYFGNSSGVLEYDGNRWRLIPVSNNSLVRSLAIDSNGIIYVGAVGEFGVIMPDQYGWMTYHSLVEKLPKEEREFADVWKTYVTPQGVYFQTFSKLILYNNGAVKIWKPKTSFHFSYHLNNEFYIIERDKGLKRMHGDSLELVPGGEFFSGLRIYSMLPCEQGKVLMATREKGLVLMDGQTKDSVFTNLKGDVNDYLINEQVYAGASLKKGQFAFATLKKGIFITNQKGAILQTLNKENGLPDDIIKNIATDADGNLWAALGKGIAHVEISAPLSTLGSAHGLNGFIWDVVRYRESIYVATSQGVSVGKKDHFIPVQGITSQTWSLKKIRIGPDTILMAASEAGVYEIKNMRAGLLQEGVGYFIYQSKTYPKRVYIGMADGLLSIRQENGKWLNEDYLEGVEKEIRSISEDEEGNLWLGTPFEGLIKIDFNAKKGNNKFSTSWKAEYSVEDYDTTKGLPGLKYNIPYFLRNRVFIATTRGIYESDPVNSKLIRSNFLSNQIGDHQIFRIASKDSTAVWLVTVAPNGTKETGVAYLQKNGIYDWYTKPFLRVFDRELHAILPDENGITWFGGPDGLLQYDSKIKNDFSRPFHALIRLIVAGRDSIFCGTYFRMQDSLSVPVSEQAPSMQPEIKYADHSILFEYTAASYGDEKNTLFNIYLEGNDTSWSGWSSKTAKEYTNLSEGNYVFHVKARNIYGTESIEATYTFTILPPWFRTTWAYIIYVVSFIGFVYLVIRLSIRRLVKAKIKLEGIVKERTAEVVQQKHLVEEKQKEIIDSINYAQRIQRALLASDKLLNENLAQYFVFFQPKDIVSGDFYWATKLSNGQFALVTADSTGHGVPGAIMSMLNISSLIEATIAQKLTNPNEILNYARAKIIGQLANDGSAEGGKDGMDCSLVSFDFTKSKMTYAAANNPVWIVRNGAIIEYDPDSMPVGKHDRDKISFTQHEVELQKNDVVYTLTDGMPDQFGGPKGKKFMYKKLKELFVTLSILPMHEQKEKLRTALNDWKGELEQVDDVCIIGVRV